jgi:hypothetical protein
MHSLMTLAFIGVWLMIASELIGRQASEAKPPALQARDRQGWS